MPSRDVNAVTRLAEASRRRDKVTKKFIFIFNITFTTFSRVYFDIFDSSQLDFSIVIEMYIYDLLLFTLIIDMHLIYR